MVRVSGDPNRYKLDPSGQWWYLHGTTRPTWLRVYEKVCPMCGDAYVPAYRAKQQQRATCSRTCGIRLQWKQNPDKAKGSNSGNWKGGRRINPQGYVLVWAPDHPNCANNKRVYVPEHRLVMEQMLGRYLLPNETVHHKNGNRQDNRPENLELWAKSQPAGQRVDDLVAWAKDILALYGKAH